VRVRRAGASGLFGLGAEDVAGGVGDRGLRSRSRCSACSRRARSAVMSASVARVAKPLRSSGYLAPTDPTGDREYWPVARLYRLPVSSRSMRTAAFCASFRVLKSCRKMSRGCRRWVVVLCSSSRRRYWLYNSPLRPAIARQRPPTMRGLKGRGFHGRASGERDRTDVSGRAARSIVCWVKQTERLPSSTESGQVGPASTCSALRRVMGPSR
jgi:hypothetical protein